MSLLERMPAGSPADHERVYAERIAELQKANDRLRTIVEIAAMLIQPTADGPQLVGAEEFRTELMRHCRAVRDEATSVPPDAGA